MASILIIDNYDSFVYNLVQLVREVEGVYHYDVLRVDELNGNEAEGYDGLIISPGPGLPTEQAMMMRTLANFASLSKPILGICLGCQAIALHFGYQLKHLSAPLHGHTSTLRHSSKGILQALSDDTAIARYHSWVVDLESLSPEAGGLIEEGYCEDIDGKQTMVVRHKDLPIWGLQFHPESIITTDGTSYISGWLSLVDNYINSPKNRQQ